MAGPRSSSLPSCPLCTESLGQYGGPSTLPCGHNLCLHCGVYLQQRQALCPLCRAPFPADLPLGVNCELRELMRMAQALTAVEGEDGWQAVTSAAKVDLSGCKHASGAAGGGGSGDASAPAMLVGIEEVVGGGADAMDLDPQPWQPDSTSPTCMAPGCGKAFSLLLRPRHHCRCCGQLFCGTCTAERLLLPPKFQQAEPQRVCASCHQLLLPIQPLLSGSIAPAVRPPVHDVTDWSTVRSLLNPPLTSRLDTDIYTATNILRQYVRSVGSLPSERTIPPTILRGCAGLAILSVAKAGLGYSLSVGSGLVVARTPEGTWSPPSALLSLASSVGWQYGVEVQDVVLVLRNHAAVKAFCGSQLGIGGSVSIAAGPVGRAAAARALAALGGGAVVYSYGSTRGAFAGVAVEGSMLRPRDSVNQHFYGRKVTARQLLVSGAVAPPPAATALYAALDALLDHAGELAGPGVPQFFSQASRTASEPVMAHHQAYQQHQQHALPPPAVAAVPSAPPLLHGATAPAAAFATAAGHGSSGGGGGGSGSSREGEDEEDSESESESEWEPEAPSGSPGSGGNDPWGRQPSGVGHLFDDSHTAAALHSHSAPSRGRSLYPAVPHSHYRHEEDEDANPFGMSLFD